MHLRAVLALAAALVAAPLAVSGTNSGPRCEKTLDVAFVFDGSGSVDSLEFAKRVALGFASEMDIGGEGRAAALLFTYRSRPWDRFKKGRNLRFRNFNAFRSRINSRRYRVSSEADSNIPRAMADAGRFFTKDKRPEAHKVVIVFTDGRPALDGNNRGAARSLCGARRNSQVTPALLRSCLRQQVNKLTRDGVMVLYVPLPAPTDSVPDAMGAGALVDYSAFPGGSENALASYVVDLLLARACEPEKEQCASKEKLDLLFLIDAPETVSDAQLRQVQEFVGEAGTRFDLNYARLGVMQANFELLDQYDFLKDDGSLEFPSGADFKATVTTLERGVANGANSDIAMQLNEATRVLNSYRRGNTRSVVILVSRGRPFLKFSDGFRVNAPCPGKNTASGYDRTLPTECAVARAQALYDRRHKLAYVNVLGQADSEDLFDTVSPAVRTMDVKTYNDLSDSVDELVKLVCATETPTASPTTSPSPKPTYAPVSDECVTEGKKLRGKFIGEPPSITVDSAENCQSLCESIAQGKCVGWTFNANTHTCLLASRIYNNAYSSSSHWVSALNPCPTASPTDSPTPKPTSGPTTNPSASPSRSPSSTPTASPSRSPTASPSSSPTSTPTGSPSRSPTSTPTVTPSLNPSGTPTSKPFEENSLTDSPTESPSVDLDRTFAPSSSPSSSPSLAPSLSPTRKPSASPSTSPSKSPSRSPSASPSATPSLSPSQSPSASPSAAPSTTPSSSPSQSPSTTPTAAPSLSPTTSPVFCQDEEKDIVFVVDVSGSVRNDLHFMQDFLVDLMSNIPMGAALTRVSVVTYATRVQETLAFGEQRGSKRPSTNFNDFSEFIYGLTRPTQDGETATRTCRALITANTLLQAARPGIKRYVIILTDGQPNGVAQCDDDLPVDGYVPSLDPACDFTQNNGGVIEQFLPDIPDRNSFQLAQQAARVIKCDGNGDVSFVYLKIGEGAFTSLFGGGGSNQAVHPPRPFLPIADLTLQAESIETIMELSDELFNEICRPNVGVRPQ